MKQISHDCFDPSNITSLVSSVNPPGTTAKKTTSKEFRMSASDRDAAFTITGNAVKNPDQYRWQGGRSEKGVVSGKWYYEAEITDNGLCRIGFATPDAYQELGLCFLIASLLLLSDYYS